jgi:hypothetical protein
MCFYEFGGAMRKFALPLALNPLTGTSVLLALMLPFSAATCLAQTCINGGACNPSTLNKIVYVDGTTYTTVQAAINAASAGGTIVVPPGTYSQGSTPISITGKQLLCTVGATITFSGLPTTADAVTMGWSDGNQRTGITGCVFQMNAGGQDAIRVNGGNHWFIRDVDIENWGRDCIHLEPDVAFHWSENSEVAEVRCVLTTTPSVTLRDGIQISLGNTGLSSVFLNRGIWRMINIRGYKQNAIHIIADNGCAGCQIATHNFSQIETDGKGHEPSANPAVFFERGGSGFSNEIVGIGFDASDFEDTSTPPTGSIFKQSTSPVLNGLLLWNNIDGNFPSQLDASITGGTANNNLVSISPSMSQFFAPIVLSKDGSGLQEWTLGMGTPLGAIGNNFLLSAFNGGVWTPRFQALASGGFNFNNTSGTPIATLTNTGNLTITGSISKSGGSFRIDHPLDPAGKYLSHSFVESPDMLNIYNGTIILDVNGEAEVRLPNYFEALNRDFRYQLTPVGGYAPVYIAQEVKGNVFRIAGGKAGLKISWEITGIRQDPYANAHRIPVEESKPLSEQGHRFGADSDEH